MADDCNSNTYEEARKQRLLENRKRFEDLGISKMSKSLTDVTKSEKPQHRQPKPRVTSIGLFEPRRSSRARNVVSSYRDEIDIELPSMRKRSKCNSSWTSYLARPVDEVRSATLEEREHALKCAEKLQHDLLSEYPFFIKSMVRSHVYSCFWLGLPTWFCENHLPQSDGNMEIVLEDENGTEYDAVYISKRTGLSGGWRAFALDHKLDDGDALVFELVEPTIFKVYIVKACCNSNEKDDMLDMDKEERNLKEISKKMTTKPTKKTESNGENPTHASSERERLNGSKQVSTETKTGEMKSTRVSARISERKLSSRH